MNNQNNGCANLNGHTLVLPEIFNRHDHRKKARMLQRQKEEILREKLTMKLVSATKNIQGARIAKILAAGGSVDRHEFTKLMEASQIANSVGTVSNNIIMKASFPFVDTHKENSEPCVSLLRAVKIQELPKHQNLQKEDIQVSTTHPTNHISFRLHNTADGTLADPLLIHPLARSPQPQPHLPQPEYHTRKEPSPTTQPTQAEPISQPRLPDHPCTESHVADTEDRARQSVAPCRAPAATLSGVRKGEKGRVFRAGNGVGKSANFGVGGGGKGKEENRQKIGCLLAHLMHGIVFSSAYIECGVGALAKGCRFHVGPGNNQKLVYTTFKMREGMAQEGFIGKSNICWTQVPDKKAQEITDNSPEPSEIALKVAKADKSSPYHALLNKPINELLDLIVQNSPASIPSPESLLLPTLKTLLEPSSDPTLPPQTLISLSTLPLYPNHLPSLHSLTRKHLLFTTLSTHCTTINIPVESILPRTWIIRTDTLGVDVERIVEDKDREDKEWKGPLIVKPGEATNRGNGIVVVHQREKFRDAVMGLFENRKHVTTCVVQEYITSPLLYKGRKFDIRAYALVVKIGKVARYFWFKEGYARTSSFAYEVDNCENIKVHLTNEAVQVKGRLHIT